jgi:hypothetical protein
MPDTTRKVRVCVPAVTGKVILSFDHGEKEVVVYVPNKMASNRT